MVGIILAKQSIAQEGKPSFRRFLLKKVWRKVMLRSKMIVQTLYKMADVNAKEGTFNLKEVSVPDIIQAIRKEWPDACDGKEDETIQASIRNAIRWVRRRYTVYKVSELKRCPEFNLDGVTGSVVGYNVIDHYRVKGGSTIKADEALDKIGGQKYADLQEFSDLNLGGDGRRRRSSKLDFDL